MFGGVEGGWQAYEYGVESVYTLRIKEKLIEFNLLKGRGSKKFIDDPFIIIWDGVQSIFPEHMYGYEKSVVVALLKEGLAVFSVGL